MGSVRNVEGIVIVNTNFTVHCMQSLTIIWSTVKQF